MKFSPKGEAVMSPVTLAHPQAEILGFFNSEANKEGLAQILAYVVSRPIMPVIVEASPILVMLTHDRDFPWKQRFTNSYLTVLKMQTILRCYTTVESLPFYEDNTERCKTVYDTMIKETQALDNELHKKVMAISEKNVKAFEAIIYKHTFAYINLLEKCLYNLFLAGTGCPLKLEQCQTRTVKMKGIKLPDAVTKLFKKHFKYFFTEKQKLTNIQYNTPRNIYFTSEKDIYAEYMRYYKKFHREESNDPDEK